MNPKTKQLILVPAVISLAVTLLRLTGELLGWSRMLFSPDAGGGGSPVGISWLIPIFGVYFALKLVKDGSGPASAGRVLGISFLGLVIAVAIVGVAGYLFGQDFTPNILAAVVASAVAIVVVRKVWPELFNTLLAYAFAARIPVAVLMFFAIMGNWGTHYDVPPSPDFPQMNWFAKWFLIGLVPQLTIWIAFTVLVGLLFGGLTAMFTKKKS